MGWDGMMKEHPTPGMLPVQAAMSALSSELNRSAAALGNLTAYLRLVALPNAM